jgi:hypothetical protein
VVAVTDSGNKAVVELGNGTTVVVDTPAGSTPGDSVTVDSTNNTASVTGGGAVTDAVVESVNTTNGTATVVTADGAKTIVDTGGTSVAPGAIVNVNTSTATVVPTAAPGPIDSQAVAAPGQYVAPAAAPAPVYPVNPRVTSQADLNAYVIDRYKSGDTPSDILKDLYSFGYTRDGIGPIGAMQALNNFTASQPEEVAAPVAAPVASPAPAPERITAEQLPAQQYSVLSTFPEEGVAIVMNARDQSRALVRYEQGMQYGAVLQLRPQDIGIRDPLTGEVKFGATTGSLAHVVSRNGDGTYNVQDSSGKTYSVTAPAGTAIDSIIEVDPVAKTVVTAAAPAPAPAAPAPSPAPAPAAVVLATNDSGTKAVVETAAGDVTVVDTTGTVNVGDSVTVDPTNNTATKTDLAVDGNQVVNTDSGVAVDTDTGVVTNPNTDTAVDTNTGTAVNASTGTAVDTNTGVATNPNTNTAVDTNTGTAVNADTGVAVDTNTGVATNPNTNNAVDTNTGVATNPNTNTAVDTNTGVATNVNTNTAVDTNTGVATNANTNTAVDTNTGTAVNANTGTAVDTNTGVATNPNTNTAVDTNTGTAVNANTGVVVDTNTGAVDTNTDTAVNAAVDAATDANTNTAVDQATNTQTDQTTGTTVNTNIEEPKEDPRIAQLQERINQLIQSGLDEAAATSAAMSELTGQISTLTQAQLTAQQEQQRAAAEAARQRRMQSGLAALAPAPGKGSNELPNVSPLQTSGAAKFISPLAAFLSQVERNDYTPTPRQQQPMTPSQPMEQPDRYAYGKEQSIDELLDPYGERKSEEAPAFKAGGLATPLFAMGGGTRYGQYAKGGLNVVHHSGKARIDFRRGDAVTGPGDGQSDDIPAMLADGEFVFPADVVAALGNGSTKAGSDKLYDMMHSIRAHARSSGPKDLPPPAKSPLEYLEKASKQKSARG